MKSGAVVRLVLWSVVALVLIGLLVSVMTMKDAGLGIINDWGISLGGAGRYSNSEKYSVGGAVISDKIDTAEINWVDGKVNVEVYDGDAFEISETGNTDDESTLRYLVENGKLTVQYRKSGWYFGIGKSLKKELTVKIPKAAASFNNFSIDSVSASVKLSDISAKSSIEIDNVSGKVALENITADICDIDNISGEITAENIKVNTFESDTVSGNITVSGEITDFKSDSTSGDVFLTDTRPLKSLNLDSVSGSGFITIPENSSFAVDFDSVSGDFDSDFALVSKNGERICGSGSADFDIDTTSGDFSVKKLAGVQ